MAPLSADIEASKPVRAPLRTRILSALVLGPVALSSLFWGVLGFDLLIVLTGVQMAREWSQMADRGRVGIPGAVLGTVILILLAAHNLGFLWLGGGLIVGAAVSYWVARRHGIGSPGWLALGILAIALPCLAMLWLRGEAGHGRDNILWLFATVWATDTGAFAFGRLIGGPRLVPQISPHKTWAGLIGGVASGALAGSLVARWVTGDADLAAIIVAGGVALISQGGDLAESIVKRHFGVKDSGSLIPGHGGILDRVDGLMAASLILALLSWTTGGSILAS